MAWTAPMTAVAGQAFTLQQFNTYVRDNLLETIPAKTTAALKYHVGTGANALAERGAATAMVTAFESCTNAGYGNIPGGTVGPAVTVTTGTQALVFFSANFNHLSANTSARTSVAVSGATTIAATSAWCLLLDGRDVDNYIGVGTAHLFTGLTPGSNTFTMQYQSTNSSFGERIISVYPL